MTGLVRRSIAAWLIVLALATVTAVAVGAQQVGGILVTSPFPNVVVEGRNQVRLDLDVLNRGDVGQHFNLVISEIPDGWQPVLRARGMVVREMYLNPEESRFVDFQVQPPEGVEPGDYRFLVQALGPGGEELSRVPLTIGIQELPIGTVRMNAQFPEVQGPSTSTFEFRVDVTNNADEERTYELTAAAPPGWTVTFRPAFDRNRQISSLRLDAGQNQGVDVDVQPSRNAPPGDYTVRVQTSGGGQTAEANLNIRLTGTQELTLGTATGRLNAQATAGVASPLSVIIANSGTAELRNISFLSSKPEGWDVQFDPDTVEVLGPGEAREINVRVTPSARAIAGDYMVGMTASSQQASRNVDMRVTVETPTLWGWVAAGIILLVIGGLYTVFRAYGRR